MKGSTRYITLTLLLCFTVLFSSVGMTLQEHFCLMSGEPVEAKNDDCCTKKEAPKATGSHCDKTGFTDRNIQQENCCELHTALQKLEPVQQLKIYSLQMPAFFPAPHIFKFVPEQMALQQNKRALFYSDSSPPRAGRDLLHFLQILII